MYKLYYSPGACSMASHILLEECGADYEPKLVALAKGEQRTEAYRAINPHGKVPTLEVDGEILTENVAILPFIARQFPAAKLVPDDPVTRAHSIETTGWFSSTAHVAFSLVLHPERPAAGIEIGEDGLKAISDNARKTYRACMEEVDTRLAGQTWMMGSQFTFLDPYALVFYGWGNRIGMPMAEFKNYTAFKDRMIARPAVRTVLEREQSPLLNTA